MMAQEPKPTDFSSSVRSLKKKTAAPATGATAVYREQRKREEKTRENLIFLCLLLLIRVRMLLSGIVIVLSYSKSKRRKRKRRKCYLIKNGIDSSIRDLYKFLIFI